jgi:ABC-type protease/lipase transport system fused ATPase/permease subunit
MKFMSGGQKSRVAFAMLTYGRPHVVIMDEPTNHLDMDAIEVVCGVTELAVGKEITCARYFLQALIDALQNFEGGVMVRFWCIPRRSKLIAMVGGVPRSTLH